MHLRTLKLREKLLVLDHPDTIASKNRLVENLCSEE
jgi:hypothetical protein